MRRVSISHVITLPGQQRELLPILQLNVDRTADAKNHMPLRAPVIGGVPRRVLNHAHAKLAESFRPPVRYAGISTMFRRRNLRPVRNRHWHRHHFHASQYRVVFHARVEAALRPAKLCGIYSAVGRNTTGRKDGVRLWNEKSQVRRLTVLAVKQIAHRISARFVSLAIPFVGVGSTFSRLHLFRLTALGTLVGKARLARLQLKLFPTHRTNFYRKTHHAIYDTTLSPSR